jgi:hypothetical protein
MQEKKNYLPSYPPTDLTALPDRETEQINLRLLTFSGLASRSFLLRHSDFSVELFQQNFQL